MDVIIAVVVALLVARCSAATGRNGPEPPALWPALGPLPFSRAAGATTDVGLRPVPRVRLSALSSPRSTVRARRPPRLPGCPWPHPARPRPLPTQAERPGPHH